MFFVHFMMHEVMAELSYYGVSSGTLFLYSAIYRFPSHPSASITPLKAILASITLHGARMVRPLS